MVVSLSASGKTARGFAWQVLTKRAQGSGPLSFSQVTHVPDTVGGVVSRPAHIPSGVFKYSQLDSAVDVAAGVKPQKLVIVDFGARQNALKKFMGLVNEKPELKGAQTVILQFEANKRFKSSFPIFTSQGKKKKKKKLTVAKVYSTEEALGIRQDMQQFGKTLYNTADILDEVLTLVEKQAYIEDLRSNWEEWIGEKKSNVLDLELVWGRGISGEHGIHAGWDRVTAGSVAPNESLLYRLA